jgi:hypothetical protein
MNKQTNINNPQTEMSCKRSGKEVKIQQFRYRDTTNVDPEMYDYTSYSWSQWNSNKKLKEKSGSYTRKTFDRFPTENSYTWNITHNTEVLQCETSSLSGGCHRWFKRSTRKKRPVTREADDDDDDNIILISFKHHS